MKKYLFIDFIDVYIYLDNSYLKNKSFILNCPHLNPIFKSILPQWCIDYERNGGNYKKNNTDINNELEKNAIFRKMNDCNNLIRIHCHIWMIFNQQLLIIPDKLQ